MWHGPLRPPSQMALQALSSTKVRAGKDKEQDSEKGLTALLKGKSRRVSSRVRHTHVVLKRSTETRETLLRKRNDTYNAYKTAAIDDNNRLLLFSAEAIEDTGFPATIWVLPTSGGNDTQPFFALLVELCPYRDLQARVSVAPSVEMLERKRTVCGSMTFLRCFRRYLFRMLLAKLYSNWKRRITNRFILLFLPRIFFLTLSFSSFFPPSVDLVPSSPDSPSPPSSPSDSGSSVASYFPAALRRSRRGRRAKGTSGTLPSPPGKVIFGGGASEPGKGALYVISSGETYIDERTLIEITIEQSVRTDLI